MLNFFGAWDLRKKLLAWFLMVAMVPMILITAANLFFSARNLRQEMGTRLAANRGGVEIELRERERQLLEQTERYAAQPMLIQTVTAGNREVVKRLVEQLILFSESTLLGIYDERGNLISMVQKMKAVRAASIEGPSQERGADSGRFRFGLPSAFAQDDFSFDLPKSKGGDGDFSFDAPSPSSGGGGMKTAPAKEDSLSPALVERIQTARSAVVRSATAEGIEISAYKRLSFSGRGIGFIREGILLDQGFIEGMKHRIGLDVALVNSEGKKIASTLPDLTSIAIEQAVETPTNGEIGKGGYLYMVLPLNEEKGASEGAVVLLQSLDPLAANQREIAFFSLLLFGGVGVIVAAVSLSTARSLTQPLHQIMEILKRAEREGDLTHRIEVKSRDEIGELGRWFNTFSEKFSSIISQVKESTRSLAVSSEELSASSQQMGSNSEETERLASTVSSASEQTNRNVQSVATAAEEMTSTLKEISKNVVRAAQITSQAVQAASTTNETISKLGESSVEIGKVIKVITSIAEQTNLLALNAAIEAARAGEAGKGFAVVANEVKDLAKKTSKATEEIGQKIAVIQTDTKEAVSAIEQISGIIAQINDIATTVAGAIEEQTATTHEISRSVSEAAKGTGEVTQSIDGVATAAKSTAEGAAAVLAASKRLAQMGADLMAMISQFRVETDPMNRGPNPSEAGKGARPLMQRMKPV
jgi:methyl-accepting chemotaxis protein